MRVTLLLSFVLASMPGLSAAVTPSDESLRYFLPDDKTTYDERVPGPEAFFGFAIGDWHLRHHELLAYYRALAAAAPERVLLEETGTTCGRRTKVLLTIASPANRKRLDAIRAANVANALGERAATRDAPAVVWLGYSIHGNEPSGANAAPIVAWHLAAGRGASVERLLENTVVLIDPFLNPDGIDRFAEWSNNHRGAVPNVDPAHREHAEGWLSGRTNYYWLDLNRDWLPAVMPESQAHLATFHRWRPAVFCDFHEMSAAETFFFQPGVPAMVNPLTPPRNQELTKRLAAHHAAALDAIGSLYFTEERYDDFYIGKGSTYPDLLGSVGILFEQASARGHSQDTPNGVLTLRFAVRNHVRASLSSLHGATALRIDLLSHQHDSTVDALREAARADVKAHVFAAPGDPARLNRFVAWLRRHAIRVDRLDRDLEQADITFRAGETVVVPMAQPAFRLISAMFEKRTAFASPAFYDVSAWNMAEACGMTWAPLESMPSTTPFSGDNPLLTVRGDNDLPKSASVVALAFAWSHLRAPHAAWRLLDGEARVRVAMEPFTAVTAGGEVPLPAGAIVVPVSLQSFDLEALHAMAARILDEDRVPVHWITTGLTPAGIDVGSQSMRVLQKPQIALVVGDGANVYHAGEVWHLLDRDLEIPISLIGHEQLNSSVLARHTVVIFSDGRFQAGDALKAWVESGGTLIVTGGAIRGFADTKWVPVELLKPEFARERVPFADAREDAATRLIAGSIVEASVDLTNPIAFGYAQPRVSLIRNRDVFLKPTTNPFSSPALYVEKPLVSGFVAEPNLKVLAGSAAVQVHHLKAGRIILLPDAPAFRSHWLGSSKLLLNAIFFGSLMKEAGARPDE